MNQPLEDKKILITGAAVRLGRAIAEGLARAGAQVALHFHQSEEAAQAVARELRQEGCRVETFRADLTHPREVANLVERVEETLGPLSALVNSAAVFDRAPFLETGEEILERQWQLNARAPFLLTRAVAERLQKQGGGDVINILDVGGTLQPWPNYSAYCMSKAAMAMLTRCLALELAPQIRVNAVLPGTVLPPEGMLPQTLEALRQRTPQRRFGTPTDVVETVLFLLTGPRFITGQLIAVDGGRSLFSSGS